MPFKLLLVDDEVNIVRSLQRVLDDGRYDFLTATTPAQAIEILGKTPVDLILCDHQMPEMLGIDVLKHAKSVQPDAVRILITGSADMNVAISAINQGSIYYFFSKPWDNEEIVRVVAEALEKKKSLTEKNELLRLLSNSNNSLLEVNKKLNSLSDLLEARTHEKAAPQNTRKITVMDEDNIILMDTGEILYLASAETAVSIITKNRIFKSGESLNAWEDKLGPDFFRCHRGYIVNINHIDKVSPWFNGAFNIQLKGISDNIPVSRNYAKKLKELLSF